MNTTQLKQKPGYKKTKLGWVPEEWEVSRVENAFKICNTNRLPLSKTVRQKMNGEYPYYGPTKIQDYINEYQYEGRYALIAEDGDHFLKYADRPMTQLVRGKFNVNNHAHVLKGKKGVSTTDWFYWFFYHRSVFSHLTRQGAGRYKLNKQSLSQLLVALPPLPEQQKIATILSTWDKAIEKLGQLIKAKEEQKKGLMQRLLTGKVRLKGFSKEWKEVKIGDLIIESKIKGQGFDPHKRLTVRLSLKGIEMREVKGSESIGATNFFLRKSGQFIYGKQNLHKGALGIIPPEFDGFETTSDIPAFDFKKGVYPKWFYYFMSRKHFYESLETLSTGTGSKRIKPSNLYKKKIKLPELSEQVAIAEILTNAITEIELIKEKLQTVQEQKKGQCSNY